MCNSQNTLWDYRTFFADHSLFPNPSDCSSTVYMLSFRKSILNTVREAILDEERRGAADLRYTGDIQKQVRRLLKLINMTMAIALSHCSLLGSRLKIFIWGVDIYLGE